MEPITTTTTSPSLRLQNLTTTAMAMVLWRTYKLSSHSALKIRLMIARLRPAAAGRKLLRPRLQKQNQSSAQTRNRTRRRARHPRTMWSLSRWLKVLKFVPHWVFIGFNIRRLLFQNKRDSLLDFMSPRKPLTMQPKSSFTFKTSRQKMKGPFVFILSFVYTTNNGIKCSPFPTSLNMFCIIWVSHESKDLLLQMKHKKHDWTK